MPAVRFSGLLPRFRRGEEEQCRGGVGLYWIVVVRCALVERVLYVVGILLLNGGLRIE